MHLHPLAQIDLIVGLRQGCALIRVRVVVCGGWHWWVIVVRRQPALELASGNHGVVSLFRWGGEELLQMTFL